MTRRDLIEKLVAQAQAGERPFGYRANEEIAEVAGHKACFERFSWVDPFEGRVQATGPARYLESVTIAAILVPEGCKWKVQSDGYAIVYREVPVKDEAENQWTGDAPTPEHALVIAALKAREACRTD